MFVNKCSEGEVTCLENRIVSKSKKESLLALNKEFALKIVNFWGENLVFNFFNKNLTPATL